MGSFVSMPPPFLVVEVVPPGVTVVGLRVRAEMLRSGPITLCPKLDGRDELMKSSLRVNA